MTLILLVTSHLLTEKVYAVSNKPIHWGFQRSTNHQAPTAGKEFDDLLKKYDSFYKDETDQKEIYLTFDNGYENGNTKKILDVLKKQKVPATFFITGHYLNEEEALVKRMVNEGHIVGNHSWHHPDFTKISGERIKKELTSVSDKISELTDQEETIYLRPPRGIFSERVLEKSHELGYVSVFWSLAFVDWKVDKQRGWKYAYDNVMKQIHPGAVILLHSVSRDNTEALEKIIVDLRKQGYKFKSLDDLMIENKIFHPYFINL
ncbi:delta-lactam-biosynthetic de-N-acetylase [Bacillus carboniphilus]|uniref:Delta-lactam-biosynthetic de-N-acetylase n=1 Tax=Bacillus carboniphilus TaxID=86663 RepID=A0ABY9JY94_9BACI|nr:delta-lactam-biosynthetic de-N-acetylase [Bacillus carboniphilus]WLR44379.1 delta-lactam-biosynthetic de-N-acetylase [Bacillus carboniphilus]